MSKTLAIEGGSPAKTGPYTRLPRYGEEELKELREALEQGTLFYAQGKKVYALEEAFAEWVGAKHAVACSSGTASIHTALMAAGISPGDEVIVSPITDLGSVVPILFQGAVPVFADLDPRNYTMDPSSVEENIGPKTKAVLAVHLWGNTCDLDALKDICDRRGLILIEDCAQAWGATYKRRKAGTVGRIGCYSLNEFKHIACGDGGLVCTDDDVLARRLRLATDKGYNREAGAAIRNPTFLAANYRMSELQGAVAKAQLPKVDDIVARRRRWVGELMARTADFPNILPPIPTHGCDPSWWFYMFRAAPGCDADKIAEALQAEGIPVWAHYIGQCVYEYRLFTDHLAFEHGGHAYQARVYGKGIAPVAEDILRDAIILPLHEDFTDRDLDETVEAFIKVGNWEGAKRV